MERSLAKMSLMETKFDGKKTKLHRNEIEDGEFMKNTDMTFKACMDNNPACHVTRSGR